MGVPKYSEGQFVLIDTPSRKLAGAISGPPEYTHGFWFYYIKIAGRTRDVGGVIEPKLFPLTEDEYKTFLMIES